MIQQIDALHQATGYGYDNAGRRQWRLDAKGQRTTYVWDRGRRTEVLYSDGSRVTLSYDNEGNRTLLQDSGGTTTYSYDELSRLKGIGYPGAQLLTYAYDEVGNRRNLTEYAPADAVQTRITTYSYDSRNLLFWLQNPRGELTTYLYDPVGRITTMAHGNGTIAETGYNAAGWVTAVRNLTSARAVISVYTYSYDNIGNRIQVLEATGDVVTWSYDEDYQLTEERRSGTNPYDIAYSYDGVGNRLTSFNGAVTITYSYDEADQLSYHYDPSTRTTYSYDANGNTTVINAAGSLTTNTWDIENRLTVVQLPGGGRTTAIYDGDGKRRSYADSKTLRNFLWDGENLLRQTDSGNVSDRAYTYNPQLYGELISESGQFRHADALGSTMQLTDASQNVTDIYSYRAFGESTQLTGTSPSRFLWIGKLGYYYQPDSFDHWVRARVYNPTNAKWVSRDPLLHEKARRPYLYMSGTRHSVWLIPLDWLAPLSTVRTLPSSSS